MKQKTKFREWPKMRWAAIKRKVLGGLLWSIFVISLLLMFKASNEPTIGVLRGTWIESWLHEFSTGNQIISDIAVGALVSLLMYVMVVWLPQQARRRRVRRNIQHHYALFKEQCIYNLLFAIENAVDPDLVDQLADIREFRAYFTQQNRPGVERWYDVMNNLEPHHVKTIATEMGVLAEEVRFTLASVDVDDEDVFAFLKRLNRTIANLRESSPSEDVKYLTNFLWELFAGWSGVAGYQERDFVKERLCRI